MKDAAADSTRNEPSVPESGREENSPGRARAAIPPRKTRPTPGTAPSTLPGPGWEPGAFKRVLEAEGGAVLMGDREDPAVPEPEPRAQQSGQRHRVWSQGWFRTASSCFPP